MYHTQIALELQKQNENLNENLKERTTNHNDFKLINLVLCVGLKIPISTCHCIILICIISNENLRK